MAQPDRMPHDHKWLRAKIGPTETVSFTATSDHTSALAVGLYRLTATEDCHIVQADETISNRIGEADTDDMLLAVGQVEYATVETHLTSVSSDVVKPWDGDDRYIHVIRATADGTLYVTLINRIEIDSTLP